MRDMDFLKSLGSELEESSSGSLINGMTPEEYADSLENRTDDETQPQYAGTLPGTAAISDMGGSEDDLPTTEISDMYEPQESSASGTGTARTADTGGELPQTAISDMGSPYMDNTAQTSAGSAGTNRQYSANSYGNSQFVTAGSQYQNIRDRRSAVYASNENIGMGIIGAMIGAALGTLLWAAISYAGYISSLGALAIVAGTFFGYILLAKDIGRGGALVVGVLIILAVYCGNRLGFAISLHSELAELVTSGDIVLEADEEIPSVGTIFRYAGDYLELLGTKSTYNANMGLSYVYTAIMSFVFFRRRFR